MESIVLKRLLFYSFLAIVAVMGLSAYLASLIVPNWEIFILFPFWHSFVAWLAFGIIAFLSVLILYFVVDLAIDKEVLQKEKEKLNEENQKLDKKVIELEKELNELKHRK